MNERSRIAKTYPAIIKTLKASTAAAVLVCLASGVSQLAIAQQAGAGGEASVPAFAPGMINHMQAMRRFKDPDQGVQPAHAGNDLRIRSIEASNEVRYAVANQKPGTRPG